MTLATGLCRQNKLARKRSENIKSPSEVLHTHTMSAGYQPPTTLSAYAEWAYYPVKPELRCGGGACGSNDSWVYKPPGGGCQYRAQYFDQQPTLACKNGAPYDCKCNLIQEPYSMAYEARRPTCGRTSGFACPTNKGSGVYYSRAPHFLRNQ